MELKEEILLNDLEEYCGMALVRTHLQQAAFFAKRAMATRPKNQLAPAEK